MPPEDKKASSRVAKRSSLILLVFAAAMLVTYPKFFRQRVQSDLYLPWRAARAVFLEHRSPYSQQLTAESQQSFYGRELVPSESQLDQRRFAYPVYATLPLVPVMVLPIRVAEDIFLIFLLVVSAASVIFWVDALQVQTTKFTVCALLAASMASPPVLQGLALRQLGLLVAALIAASAAAARRGNLLLAGALLAVSTIKPQEALLTVLLMMFWSLRSGKKFAIGFGVTLLGLVIGGELASPGWVRQFLTNMVAYRRYAGASGAEILLGKQLGPLFTALVMLWLGRRVWNARNSHDFVRPLTLVLGIQLLIVPGLFALYNAVLLLPAALLLIRPALPAPVKSNGGSAGFSGISSTGVVRPDQDQPGL